jgi:hypothetical protein
MYLKATLTSLKVDYPIQPATLLFEVEQKNEASQANLLFNQAVQEGWNLELDWLWLATRVTLKAQQQYCFEQALFINPNSQSAKQALKRLR